jgi:hypothetical protein
VGRTLLDPDEYRGYHCRRIISYCIHTRTLNRESDIDLSQHRPDWRMHSHARKTERQRQRAATDSARESGEISERMDGIGLEGVKPIPEMSVGPEGRKEKG